MADDRIKLGVDFGNTAKDAKQVASSLGEIKESAQDVAETYQVLAGLGSRYSIPIFDERGEVKKAEASLRSYAITTKDVGEKAKNLNHEFLNASRGFQDFMAGFQSNGVQGAFVGISNNLESVARLLGGGAGLAVGLNVVGGLLPIVTSGIKGFFDEFRKWGSDRKLGGLEALVKGLEAVKEEIDKIKAADVWNLETVQKYNQALESQASIEKDIADRKKSRNDYEAFMASAKPEDAARSSELRKDFAEQFAGRGAELQAELMKGLEAEAELTRDRLRRDISSWRVLVEQARKQGLPLATTRDREKQVKELEEQLAKIGEGINKKVVDLMAEAAGGTNAVTQINALQEMQRVVSPQLSDQISRVITGDPTGGLPTESVDERAKRLKEDRDKEQARVDALNEPTARAEFSQAVSDEMTAQERALNGGLTLAETDMLAKSNRTEFRARQGQASEAEIRRTLAENESMLNDIDQSGGFGSAAYEAFVQTNAQLREVLGLLRQAQSTDQMFRQQMRVTPTRLNRGR